MNYQAFQKHFAKLTETYGSVQVASLVEKHGPEAIVGDRYKENMDRLNDSGGCSVGFEWFDFHAMCKGMKFEVRKFPDKKHSKPLDAFRGFSYSCSSQILPYLDYVLTPE